MVEYSFRQNTKATLPTQVLQEAASEQPWQLPMHFPSFLIPIEKEANNTEMVIFQNLTMIHNKQDYLF